MGEAVYGAGLERAARAFPSFPGPVLRVQREVLRFPWMNSWQCILGETCHEHHDFIIFIHDFHRLKLFSCALYQSSEFLLSGTSPE